MSFIFDKLAPLPLNERFKICFESFFESNPVKKTVSVELKRGIFLILHFVRHANNGRATDPPAYAIEYITIQALNRHGSVL